MKRAHVVPVAILVLIVAGRFCAAQETNPDLTEMSREELKTQLNEKTAKLQRLRQKYYRGLRERERNIRSAAERRASLTSQLTKLEARKDERTETLSTLRDRIEKQQETLNELSAFTDRFREKVSKFREKLRAYIHRTVPYRRSDRLKKIRPADEAASGNGKESDPVGQLRRLWRQALNEFRSGRSSGIHKRNVRLPDGREKFARVARIGYRIQFFVTDDRKEAGIWVPALGDDEDRWRIRMLKDRDPLIRALDMIRGHAAPGRVLLPVSLLPESKD